MRKSTIGIIAASLTIICLFTYFFISITNNKEAVAQGTTKTNKATVVKTASVESGDITQRLSLVGSIEARSQVLVFAKIPGKIEKLNVEIGDSVNKNDVLAVVEHEELKLSVKQAEAALKAAKAGLNQAQKLSKIKVMSQVRQAKAGLAAAKAGYEQVKDISATRTDTQIAQAEAGLEAIKANLQKIKEGAREEEKKQVKATVKQAKAGLDNAESNYERMQKLFEQGAISKQTFEGIETQYTVAKAQHKAAIQQLELVKKGAREEDIQAVEAQVKQAEAGLKLAKKMANTKSWEKDIARAKAGVEQAEAGLEAAMALKDAKSWETEITGAETSVEQAKVGLELARKKLSDATITASISGIVSKRNVDLGDMASPQAPIFEIVDMDTVKAKVSVIESDLHKIKVGNEARVSVDAVSEEVKGEVTNISPTLSPKTRNATVEITVENPEHKLRPGMFAKASVIIEKHTSVSLVPSSAVVYEDEKPFVYTVAEVAKTSGNINIAKMVSVQTGFSSDSEDMIEIISGLSSQDKVVVAGHFGLKDGTRVRVQSKS